MWTFIICIYILQKPFSRLQDGEKYFISKTLKR